MNTFLKYLLAAVVVLVCVGAGALVGCVAGFFVTSEIPGVVQTNVPGAGGSIGYIADNRWLASGAFIGTAVGTLLGLAGGGLLAAKVINPPPPRE